MQTTESLISQISNIVNLIEVQSAPVKYEETPRFLNNSEILNIVKNIPMFIGALPTIGRVARNSIIKQEKNKLREIVLSPDAIEEFIEIYISKFNASKVEPGTATGFQASEAISGPLSQQTFNSFQNAGSSKNMTGGIESFLETLANQNRRHPFMVVHYKDKVTIDDILIDKQKKLRTVTVADCILRHSLETPDSLFSQGIPDWYNFYKAIIDPSVGIPKTWILRLFLNLDALYYYKIKPYQISDLLSSEKDNDVNIIKCIYSPIIKHDNIDTIIMDVYIYNIEPIVKDKELKNLGISEELAGIYYFRNVFIPKLSEFKLQGLDDIHDVNPINLPIQMSLYAEYPASRYASEYSILKNKYINFNFLKLNRVFMRSNNIRLSDVLILLKGCGINNIIRVKKIPELSKDFDDLELLVELPPPSEDFPKDKEQYKPYGILTLVKYKIDIDTSDIDTYRKEQKKIKHEIIGRSKNVDIDERKKLTLEANSIKIYKEPSIISKSANLYYAETSGSDYYSLFNLPDVDYTRSYSNNMNDTLMYYGIEAVRTYIIRDLILLVTLSDSYIDPRHATLVADWMTALGSITALTPKGMKKHDLGAIANAAFREPMKGFKNEAMLNRTDRLKGIAGPLALGTYVEMGTGYVDVRPIDNLRTKKMLESVKKQNKKLTVNISSSIVSLLENPDLIDPFDRSSLPVDIDFRELNLPLLSGPIDTNFIETNKPMVPIIPGLDELFPLVSKELRQAIDNSRICEPPLIPITTSIMPRGSDHPMEPLPIGPFVIPEGTKEFESTERPPEVIGSGIEIDLETLF